MNQEQAQNSLRLLLTVRQFSEKYPAFSEPSLRNLIFNAFPNSSRKVAIEGNGLAIAILKVGRKILIDEAKFLEWLELQKSMALDK